MAAVSAVILEPPKIKSSTVFTVSPKNFLNQPIIKAWTEYKYRKRMEKLLYVRKVRRDNQEKRLVKGTAMITELSISIQQSRKHKSLHNC